MPIPGHDSAVTSGLANQRVLRLDGVSGAYLGDLVSPGSESGRFAAAGGDALTGMLSDNIQTAFLLPFYGSTSKNDTFISSDSKLGRLIA